MSKKAFSVTRWFIALVSVFLIGFLSMPNHMSLLTIHIDQHRASNLAGSPNSVVPEDNVDHHALSSGVCCPFCIFIVFQSVSAIPGGDSLKVEGLTSIFHVVYIKSIIPPPKA
jgi:hypothetical protein